MEQVFNISLTTNQLQVITIALGKFPYSEVCGVMSSIEKQLADQQKENEKPVV